MNIDHRYKLFRGAHNFFAAFVADARSAKSRVYVQTLAFEGDQSGLALEALYNSLPATVDKKILVDRYSRYIINDKFIYSPMNLFDRRLHAEKRETISLIKRLNKNGSQVKYCNPLGPMFMRMPARNHRKILIVDDRIAYIGGVNFSDHNFAWHDLMLRVSDPKIVRVLSDDFLKSWSGIKQGAAYVFDDSELIFFDGVDGRENLKKIISYLDSAEDEIFIESPYFSQPFYDVLRRAQKRGVKCRLVAPNANNWGFYDSYTAWESKMSGIDLHYFPGMNHLKCILVDKKYLLLGSCNFDFFSVNTHQELVLVIANSELIESFVCQFRDPDLAISPVRDAEISAFDGKIAKLALRILFKIGYLLNHYL